MGHSSSNHTLQHEAPQGLDGAASGSYEAKSSWKMWMMRKLCKDFKVFAPPKSLLKLFSTNFLMYPCSPLGAVVKVLMLFLQLIPGKLCFGGLSFMICKIEAVIFL